MTQASLNCVDVAILLSFVVSHDWLVTDHEESSDKEVVCT